MVSRARLGRILQLAPRNIHGASKCALQRRPLHVSTPRLRASPVPLGLGHLDRLEEPADVNSEKPIIKIHPRQRPRIWQTDFSNPTGRVIGYAHQKDMHPRGEPFIVERSWLRNACACDICVDASSGQKRFAPSEVPSELPVSGLSITKEGSLKVFWENDFFTHDTHMSTYPLSIWQGTPPPLKTWVPKPWGMSALRKVSPYYSYESFITGEGEKFRRGMISLHLYGIIFLYDVPSSEGAVEEIASKIGTIQETFYGRTWDVKSKPEAENVAYTNSFLGLHQDLLYLSNVPRIQLLHCLENTCTGGESLFSDSYWAIQRLFRKHPEYIRVLRKRPVVYHYNKGDHVYRQSRPVLGDTGLWWSPPFQNPVQPDSLTHYGMEDYRLWHKATRVLQAMLEMENCVYELKMTPGVCVIFDNRRVTHGRRSFDTGSGKRWLKGTYVENDSYCSKIRSLSIGEPTEPLKAVLHLKNIAEMDSDVVRDVYTDRIAPGLLEDLAS